MEAKNFSDVLGKGNEFVESITEAVNERINSPFYGRFFVSWAVINWQLVYIAFFTDAEKLYEKTGLLKSEYLIASLPKEWDLLLYFFVYPFLLSVLFTWVFPYACRLFYQRQEEEQRVMRKIRATVNRDILTEETQLVATEKKFLEEQLSRAQTEKRVENETPEIAWAREFKDFRKSHLFQKFQQIIDSVYKYAGRKEWFDGSTRFLLETDVLVYADSNDLIAINQREDTISLTEKGKFFVKEFSKIDPIPF